jgi:integrase
MPNLSPKNKKATTTLALRLPETAVTRSGVAFRPNEDVWDWTDGPFKVHIDFLRIDGQFSKMREPLKSCLLVYAKGYSSSHLTNLYQAFENFKSTRDSTQRFTSISLTEVSNYATRLEEHQKWRIGTFNVLLQKWVALGLPGVDHECAQYLSEKRKPGNEKGAAVRTRDPVHGPFSAAEYTALYRAVDAAYGAGEIPLWMAVLTRLLFACGGRISQYASLKLEDLESKQGTYVLRLPQAKTRQVHSRMSFKEFDLSPQTGRLLQEYVDGLISVGHNRESPMFHENTVMPVGHRTAIRNTDDMFFGHCTKDVLSQKISAALDRISPPTERLGYETTPVTPQRFRYTFGTRLVEEGASKNVVADRLGHTDLQNVEVYFEASPKIVDNIDKAMDAQLAPLARAFRGRLVEGEDDTTHRGAPGSRIIDFRVAKAPIGSCGGKGNGCEFNKPVACYTCFKFEPWLDAPHEKVLQRLTKERERFANDKTLAQINDDAILAVQEVIAECAQVHEQRAVEAYS